MAKMAEGWPAVILVSEFNGGAMIHHAIQEARRVAVERNEDVVFVFNGTPAIFKSTDTPQSAYSQWCALRKAYQDWDRYWSDFEKTPAEIEKATAQLT